MDVSEVDADAASGGTDLVIPQYNPDLVDDVDLSAEPDGLP